MAIILCDLDGTLLLKDRPDPPGAFSPKRAAINRALAAVCAAPGVDFSRGLQHGLTDWQISERAVRLLRPDAHIDRRAWGRICTQAEALFTPPDPDAVPLYRRLPGVPEVLHALKEAGHALGLVTGNVAFFAFFKLAQAGIDRRLFDGPAAFGDHGRERADLLRTALARAAGAGGRRAIVLGDTIHDLAGARAVGLPFLGTGATGLRREEALAAGGPAGTPATAWVPDLGDVRAVVEAAGSLALG